MHIIKQLSGLNPFPKPIALTIGNFDSVHLGHQFLLNRLNEISKQKNGQSIVFTFENHPKTVLHGNQSHTSICTLSHKIKLLEDCGIDGLILLPFTKTFAEQTAKDFLVEILKNIPFTHLVLGHDAAFGKDRQGTKENVLACAKELNIEVEYLKPLKIDDEIISSGLIKELIKKSDFKKIEKWLGRKYSIYGELSNELTLDVTGLCLPPAGNYVIELEYDDKKYKGTANLNDSGQLHLHLQDIHPHLLKKYVNIVFYS